MVQGITGNVFRYPILLIVYLILLVEFICYIAVRLTVLLGEYVAPLLKGRTTRRLYNKLASATTFDDWSAAARELDTYEQRDKWKHTDTEKYSEYDYALIHDWLATMSQQRSGSDIHGLVQTLTNIFNTDNPAGINNSALYNQTHFGTKQLILDFVQAVTEALIIVRDSSEIELTEKIGFFKRCRTAYGRTALMLSGGASLGYFHIGILQTLHQAKLLPTVMAGASCGALIGSFVGTRTDEELERDLFTPDCQQYFTACKEPKYVLLWRYLKHGHMFDLDQWVIAMKAVTMGDMTFAQAYKKTNRIINISLTSSTRSSPPILCNYKTTPDIIIWSAVLASAAFPNIIPPVELKCMDKHGKIVPYLIHGKRWKDGTLASDIPISSIAKLWNAHFIIVSQTNPHVLPFFFNTGHTGRVGQHRHGSGLRGGFLLNALEKAFKTDMKKWIGLLNEYSLLPEFFGTDWRLLFNQPLTGTITCVPQWNILHFMRIITDPDRHRMVDYMHRGARSVYPAMVRISNHLRLENTIQQSYTTLLKQAAASKQIGHNGRPYDSDVNADSDASDSATSTPRNTYARVGAKNQSVPKPASRQKNGVDHDSRAIMLP